MYLVIGATGNVGSRLVQLLAEDGHAVRALVRDPARAHMPEGVEVAVGDLEDPASLEAAMREVQALFHMQANPAPTQTETVIAAAEKAGVDRAVAMTSMGAILEPLPSLGTMFRAQEDLWRASGIDVTLLRPNALMSNAFGWKDSILQTGTVSDPCGDGRMPVIDSHDIAAVAATALTQPGHEGHAYLLGGPEALTSREQVEILAGVLGRPIEFIDITPAEHGRAAVEHGAPEQMAPVIENLFTMFRAGRAGVLTDDVRNVTGTTPGTFRAWCERNAHAF